MKEGSTHTIRGECTISYIRAAVLYKPRLATFTFTFNDMYVIYSNLRCDFQNLDSLDVEGFFVSRYQNCVNSLVHSVYVT
jgi:hypothetical protein